MAKKSFKGDLYERMVNGEIQYRYGPAVLDTSRVARDQWKAQGWVKSAGKAPVGVSISAETPKKTKPKKEAPETAIEVEQEEV